MFLYVVVDYCCVKTNLRHPHQMQRPLDVNEHLRVIIAGYADLQEITFSALAVHMKDKHLLGKGAPITLRCKICQEAFFSESALSKVRL